MFRLRIAIAVFALAATGWSAEKANPSAPAGKKSALNRAALEAYVRHLFVWGPQIQVTIDEPKPSQLPGFLEVGVHAAAGNARQDEKFYVSRDGQKIVRGQVFDVNLNPFKPELDKLRTEFQPSFGTPGAPVVLVVFSDFQCPYCREEAKMLRDNVVATYPKQVRVYFKDLPLEQIHNWAKPAALAGRCVFRQNAGAFWRYHDWVFEAQDKLTAENFRDKVLEFANQHDLDSLQLRQCLDTKATLAEVEKSVAEARELRVMSTPTLFVNGRRIPARIGWPELKQVIDFEIEYQKTAKNAGEDCGCEVKLPTPLN